MPASADLALASTSPRRQQILRDAGMPHMVVAPSIDDSALMRPGVAPGPLTASLAWFKARLAIMDLPAVGAAASPRFVVAADTVCVIGGAVLGKPTSVADARSMLERLAGCAHRVLTGIAMVDRATGRRMIRREVATVRMGCFGPGVLAAYLDSGEWQGKAGAYNWADRVEAGWPLHCEGDPETVMGLPSAVVRDQLLAWGWQA